MTQTSKSRSKPVVLVVAAGFLLLSLGFTWPLATSPFTHVIGHAERDGVPPLNTWAMATVWKNLWTRPGRILQGSAFYPYDDTVAFSEHLFVPALMAGPVAVTTRSWTFAYNVSIWTALTLAGFFMFLLARELGASTLGAFLGGGLYAFNTWNINETVRSQILSNEFFPLVVLACLRFAASPSWSRAFAVGGAALAQALSCMYWALYLPFLIIPIVVAIIGRRLAALLRIGVALGSAALVVLAFSWPYVVHARTLGLERNAPLAVPLDRYLQVLPQNMIYGDVLDHGQANQNAAHFQGFIAMALCVPGAFLLWRRQRRFAAALLFLCGFGFLASLGPDIQVAGRRLGPGIYSWLYEYVPVFGQIRYPERFAIFVNLAVAVWAALGLSAVGGRFRPLAALVLVAALAEHLSIPQFLDPMPPADISPAVYSAVKSLPEDAVVAEIPTARYRMERRNAMTMFYAIDHGKRTIEGFTGYFPPLYSLATWHLFDFPSSRSLRFLSDLGVTNIVDRTDQALPSEVVVLGTYGDARLLQLPPRQAGSFMDDAFVARPELEEIPRDAWDIRLPERDAKALVLSDGDARTVWSTGGGQTREAFVRIRFPKPERLGRIRLFIPLPAEFPTRFRVEALVDDALKSPVVGYDEDWAFSSLARSLWKAPRTAFMDIDIEPTLVSGFRIRVTEEDAFRMPITLSEIRAYRTPESR